MTPLWNTRGRPTNKASQLDSADESGSPGDDDQLQNGHSEPAPAPSDVLPSLDAYQLSALRLQSTALALMALRGDLPASFARPMAAVVADTAFEPRRVYEHLLWLTQTLGDELPIHIVRAIRRDGLGGH